jgi:2'-5' RNA ligase
MIRLFVGVELPEDVRARLAGLCGGVPGARWVAPESLHLTLRFIGDVAEDVADDANDAHGALRAPAFDLEFAGVGHFDSAGEVRVLWAGVAKSPALVQLQRTIESALVRIGLPREERRFSPHVTLARLQDAPLARVSAFLAQNALFRAGPFAVEHFTLFSSHRRAAAPIYRAEAEYPLALAPV